MISGPYAAALVSWREAVADIYREVRARHGRDARSAWRFFRDARDRLYKEHVCSALSDDDKPSFRGFDYYDYDPRLCVTGAIDYAVAETVHPIAISEGVLPCRRVAVVRFAHAGEAHALDLFWLDIYGGGLWLPVADATNGEGSYSGGRYLFDTTKGADLGLSRDGTRLLLDLNFLYPPSCALSASFVCPLSPPGNRLSFKVEAGERHRA